MKGFSGIWPDFYFRSLYRTDNYIFYWQTQVVKEETWAKSAFEESGELGEYNLQVPTVKKYSYNNVHHLATRPPSSQTSRHFPSLQRIGQVLRTGTLFCAGATSRRWWRP